MYLRDCFALNPSTTTVYARSAFYPNLRFTLSLQSAFYTQSAFYPWSAVCSLQSAVCVLHWPIKSGLGRRVSSKNSDFCNFCDSSKNCEKLEKSQFLLKLIKSSGTGGRRLSSKNCNFSKNCENWRNCSFAKLITTSVGGGKRAPSKNCDFCSFSKNYNNLKKSQFLLKLMKSSVN